MTSESTKELIRQYEAAERSLIELGRLAIAAVVSDAVEDLRARGIEPMQTRVAKVCRDGKRVGPFLVSVNPREYVSSSARIALHEFKKDGTPRKFGKRLWNAQIEPWEAAE